MVDFYRSVPKDRVENIQYRLNMRRKAERDSGLRAAIVEACKADILFFLNAIAWLQEPRKRYDIHGKLLPNVFPFITWPHQDKWIVEAYEALGVRDIGIEKCRDEGASWAGVLFAVRDWLFGDNTLIGIASSTQAKSDSKSMGSIMRKIDWELTMLPKWMVGVEGRDWERNQKDHSLLNFRNSCQITAYAAKSDTARGERFSWFMIDELASKEWKREQNDYGVMDSLLGATDSRFIPSTPNGPDGQFFELMHNPSSMLKIVIDWRENITKNRGLYQFDQNGLPAAIDPKDNPLPAKYCPPTPEVLSLFSRLRAKGFVLEGKVRSPWYDNYCDRASATPQSVAKELDRNYGGSSFCVFDDAFMEVVNKTVSQPAQRGEFIADEEGVYHFSPQANGPFYLWCPLDFRGNPARKMYVVACDVGSGLAGSYTSNSALVVLDSSTGEQVLEIAVNYIKPDRFAELAVNVCKWFHNAYLGWEHMGPGAAFGNDVVNRLRYPNIYRRPAHNNHGALTGKRGAPGWVNNKAECMEFLANDIHTSVRLGHAIVRSMALKDEFKQYIKEDGVIRHSLHRSATDDSVGKSHGDRVIALGVAILAMKDIVNPRDLEDKPESWSGEEPPYNTIAYRDWLQDQVGREDEWDDRSTAQLGCRHALAG